MSRSRYSELTCLFQIFWQVGTISQHKSECAFLTRTNGSDWYCTTCGNPRKCKHKHFLNTGSGVDRTQRRLLPMRLRRMSIVDADKMIRELYDADGNLVSGVISKNKIPDVPGPATLSIIEHTKALLQKETCIFYNPPEYSPSQNTALQFFGSHHSSQGKEARFESQTIYVDDGEGREKKTIPVAVYFLKDPLVPGRSYQDPPNETISLLLLMGAVMAVCPQAQVDNGTHERFEYDGCDDAILHVEKRYLCGWDLLSQFWISVGSSQTCYSSFVHSHVKAWTHGIQGHVGLGHSFSKLFQNRGTKDIIHHDGLAYLSRIIKKGIIGYVRLLDNDWPAHFRCLCPSPEISDAADIVADYGCTLCLYVSAPVHNTIIFMQTTQ